jgi:hypothetical protein
MGEQSKKHHYVPQSVLRGFSSDQAQTRIYVFDKTTMRSFTSRIYDAGCENQFNSIEVEGQTVSFEGLFQTNDDQLARLLNTIRSNKSLAQLTPEDRIALSEVIAAQTIRTKMVRTTMRSIVQQLSESLREAGMDPGEVDGFSIPTDQEIKRAALASFLDLQGIVGSLQEKRPILIHSSDSRVFWISDNPVVLHNSFPYGEHGLNAPGIEVYFPVSSDLVLGFFCPSIGLKIQQLLSIERPGVHQQKYEEISRGLQQGNSVSMGLGTVQFLNELQVLSSSRFLYSSNDDFEQAREILERQPAVRDVQTLISVGRLGEWPNLHPNMPGGLWVVFYGRRSHYMVAAEIWDENSAFLEFETRDEVPLREVLSDQPLEKAALFQDRAERRSMREVQIEVSGESAPFRVKVTHRNEVLNLILQSS